MTISKTYSLLLVSATVLILATAIAAEVPKVISYQGRLTDASGNPIADGDYTLTFQIVEHDPMPMGESPLWSSGPQTVTTTDGLFSYYLGSNVSLPAEIFNDDGLDSYFLRIQVQGSLLFLKGAQLVTVPFAVRSLYSDTAAYALAGPGGGGSNGWIDDGSVVRLDTYTDFVGIGTNSPHAPLVVGKDLGSYMGQYIVSGSYYLDDVCGFKMGYSADYHTTIQWNGDGAPFALHTRESGTNYNNTLVASSGNVGIGVTPDNNKALHIEKTYDLTEPGSSAIGIYSNVREISPTNPGLAIAGEFRAYGNDTYGVYAVVDSGSNVAGRFVGNEGTGIVASGDFKAAYLLGDVSISGNLSKSSGSFRIDHPLDPESKYLQHSFVESPDMMNIYNGNVITDENGLAEVILPEYFEALNMDFRYQLTVIGEFAQAIVNEKIVNGKFSIRTDKPNIEVSWQVTGVRQDRWANEHRIQVELDKPDDEKGYYIAPELYGFGREKGIDYKLHRRLENRSRQE